MLPPIFIQFRLQRLRQFVLATAFLLTVLAFIYTLLEISLFLPHRRYLRPNNAEIDIEEIEIAGALIPAAESDKIGMKLHPTDASEDTAKKPFNFKENAMEKMFEERTSLSSDVCMKYYNYGPNASFIPYREVSYRFIYVDDIHKILYCSVPKVASTNWKRMFMMLDNNSSSQIADLDMEEVHEGNATWPYIKPLKSYSPVEVAQRIQNYTKIMWVRNPLHRLVSAWRSKFTMNNTFYNDVYGSHIIRKYRPNASEAEIQAGFPVTLNEFFLYLRDEGLVRGDVHWSHFHTHCLSCIIPYDYVGKLEDMAYEATYIMRKLTGNNSFEFPLGSERKVAPSVLDGEYMAAIKQLPMDLLQYIVMEYKIDYEMFGYAIPKFFD